MPITQYRWRIKDKRTGRWRELRWTMAPEEAAAWAAAEGAEIEQVENSAEVRHDVAGERAWGPNRPGVPGK